MGGGEMGGTANIARGTPEAETDRTRHPSVRAFPN